MAKDSGKLGAGEASERDFAELFSVEPDKFVTTRSEFAERAERAGRKDLAIRAKSLRKPTRLLWLLNQVSRRHPDDVRRLIEASDRLRREQESPTAEAAAIREAGGIRHEATARLLEQARAIAKSSGYRPPDPGDFAAALLGASSRPEGAKLFRSGRLEVEPELARPGEILGGLKPKRRARSSDRGKASRRK